MSERSSPLSSPIVSSLSRVCCSLSASFGRFADARQLCLPVSNPPQDRRLDARVLALVRQKLLRSHVFPSFSIWIPSYTYFVTKNVYFILITPLYTPEQFQRLSQLKNLILEVFSPISLFFESSRTLSSPRSFVPSRNPTTSVPTCSVSFPSPPTIS